MKDVIIVGAGVAGLICARRLQEAGRECLVVEAAAGAGGRVRTDEVDGFLLDRGFQILLTAYPEARRWLDFEELQLRRFPSGAEVWAEGQWHRVADPRRHPAELWATLSAPVTTTRDKRLVAQWALESRVRRARFEDGPETSAFAALRARGFSARMIEGFWRPWLGGIFLERELETSSRMLDFVFGMFVAGEAAVPAGGMQAIPDQLAAGLAPGSLRLRAPVAMVREGGVELAGGEQLTARDVVVATDGAEAARWLPEVAAPRWRATTCCYYAAAESPGGDGYLHLNGGGDGEVNHAVVMSDVAPGYAPPGQALIAVNLIGDDPRPEERIDEGVRREVRAWWGEQVDGWRLLRVYRVSRALPARRPLTMAPVAPVRPGLWVCGDHRRSPSLQGAMRSGREVADAIILTRGR